jgi:glutaredoxin 3
MMAPVEIYTQRYCSFCHYAKELLSRKGAKYSEIDVTGDREKRREMTERANGRTTVPQIFVGTTHVGGCDELYALDGAGKLDSLLAAGESEPA